ncbi:MAG: hypothetical protein SGI71_01635 [Verrucomicrobiota bacterium]|nr:hypothetical protein [Verrucomicrobiota bacterium]
MAVLFVDLVDSSVYASVLGLEQYAQYVDSFGEIVRRQTAYLFEKALGGKYRKGFDYNFEYLGDQLVVFLHSGNGPNDVYQLAVLAITLKCAWLAAPLNRERMKRLAPTSELAAGINYGQVWARKKESGYDLCGYAINLGKRVETYSRMGQRFRIYLSDPAFKQINFRMRNLLFGSREQMDAKGIVGSTGVHEIYDSFVNPGARMDPDFARSFEEVAEAAVGSNSFDLWIHSSLQVMSEARENRITDELFALCRNVLNICPDNAVALYYLGQGFYQRNDYQNSLFLYGELVKKWPRFADGWLEYGRLLKKVGRTEEARAAICNARLFGVGVDEEELP